VKKLDTPPVPIPVRFAGEEMMLLVGWLFGVENSKIELFLSVMTI
jgi:hypothetical protein